MSSSSAKTYIACRVCESVFLSTKALINHLESHLVNEGDVARVRKQLQLSHLLSSQQKGGLIQPGSPATTALPFQPSPQIQSYSHHSKRFCPSVQVPPLQPAVPYSQRNPFNLQPMPNPYLNPNPNPFPNPPKVPARNLNTGTGSGSKKRRSVSFPKQTTKRMATEETRGERPFLSLLDYPIPQMMNSNCNGNSDHDQLDLTLKL